MPTKVTVDESQDGTEWRVVPDMTGKCKILEV